MKRKPYDDEKIICQRCKKVLDACVCIATADKKPRQVALKGEQEQLYDKPKLHF